MFFFFFQTYEYRYIQSKSLFLIFADKEKHEMLSGRRNQYKKAALAAKKKGDMAMATKYAKTAKVLWLILLTLLQGSR